MNMVNDTATHMPDTLNMTIHLPMQHNLHLHKQATAFSLSSCKLPATMPLKRLSNLAILNGMGAAIP